jgi:hypothetical protein
MHIHTHTRTTQKRPTNTQKRPTNTQKILTHKRGVLTHKRDLLAHPPSHTDTAHVLVRKRTCADFFCVFSFCLSWKKRLRRTPPSSVHSSSYKKRPTNTQKRPTSTQKRPTNTHKRPTNTKKRPTNTDLRTHKRDPRTPRLESTALSPKP